jgi:hypothetical protein
VEGRSPRELADKVREQRTARFSYGWAWGDPALQPDGLRGVGVTDFSLTRVVGVPIPARSLEQMRAVPIRRPLSWLFFRFVSRKLRHQTPDEHRIDGEESDSPQPPNPLWPVLVLDVAAAEAVAASRADEIELRIDLTGARALLPRGLSRRVRYAPLRVSMGADGVPRRIAISPDTSKLTDETWWHVVEFAEFGVDCEVVDLWAEWERAKVC